METSIIENTAQMLHYDREMLTELMQLVDSSYVDRISSKPKHAEDILDTIYFNQKMMQSFDSNIIDQRILKLHNTTLMLTKIYYNLFNRIEWLSRIVSMRQARIDDLRRCLENPTTEQLFSRCFTPGVLTNPVISDIFEHVRQMDDQQLVNAYIVRFSDSIIEAHKVQYATSIEYLFDAIIRSINSSYLSEFCPAIDSLREYGSFF